MLEVSGVAEVRRLYWETFNGRKQEIISRDIARIKKNFLQSKIFSEEERSYIKNEMKVENIDEFVPPETNAEYKKPEIAEDFIISSISDEILATLQTALLL